MRGWLLLVAGVLLSGCVPQYVLVPPAPTTVAQKALKITPPSAWNRVPKGAFDIEREENWTQNGPILDVITFIAALRDGEAIVKQRPKDEQKVPVFHSDMTPQDLVSMLESYYRIRGAKVFETIGVAPTTFLGQSGVQFDYAYAGSDEVKRRGRAVFAVHDGQLYLMSLDGAALHYFDAALPQFEAMRDTASIG